MSEKWIEEAEELRKLKEEVKYLRAFKNYYESNDNATSVSRYLKELKERVEELEEEKYQDQRQVVLEGLYEDNKRYREAINYVMSAKVTHYINLENALNDIKFVINETLEESE